MYNPQNWEKWVNRELLHQLAAKAKIELPKGEATERYDRNFHMTHGRIILPHDYSLLHDAECRVRHARNARKGTDRNALKKKLKDLETKLDIEKNARMDLESKSAPPHQLMPPRGTSKAQLEMCQFGDGAHTCECLNCSTPRIGIGLANY